MWYGDTAIADTTWELDDRARTTQKALAAISVENHLRTLLRIDHKLVTEDEGESKKNDVNVNEKESEESDAFTTSYFVSPGYTCDGTVQGDQGGEFNGMDTEAEVDEETGRRYTIPHPSLYS